MCGRYYFDIDTESLEIERILKEFELRDSERTSFAGGEVCPSQYVPVYTWDKDKIKICLMKWGFPKQDGKGLIINARSETVKQKKIFSQGFKTRRCIAVGNGFFEWDKNKNKYFFTYENSLMYFAGIYSSFLEGNEQRDAFVILTAQANESIEDIHDRMPVVLFENELEDYLTDEEFAGVVLNRGNVRLDREICGIQQLEL